jgi:serine/threonine-protein kinase
VKLPHFISRPKDADDEAGFAATVAQEPDELPLAHSPAPDDIVVNDAPPADDRPFDELPTIGHIGRYALKYRLGEGGLGTVYAAHDPLLSRAIAVKMLHVEVEPEHRVALEESFLQEARAAAGLNHPHIVTVYDAGTSEQGLYIAMERLKGQDLRQLLQGGWRPTPQQASQIVRRVADALAYAHDKGVVHCDIKPANIFMVSRTSPKVLDFGIARVGHKQGGNGHAALAGGSPHYMAPEQLRGEVVDRRSDVYSLGAVLYELLTGRKAFSGSSLEEIVEAALNQPPRPVLELNPTVPPTLAAVAERAMAKDPAQRFRSARHLSQALKQWMTDQPTKHSAEAVQRANRMPWILGGVAVGGGVLGLALWLWPHGDATQSAAPVASAPASAASAPIAAASAVAAAASAPDAAASVPEPEASAASAAAEPAPATPVRTAAAAPNARKPRDKASRAASTVQPSVPAAPAMGTLQLAITPWGNVEVDGAAAGTAPPLNHLNLSAGTHTITVRNADFPPYTTTVKIDPEQPAMLRYRFGS